MVIDIRQGVVNRYIEVGKQLHDYYSGLAIPNPPLAKKLDDAFRNLGFHMKVLGKDIVTKAYAKPKIPTEKNKRRPSFPGLESCTSFALPPNSAINQFVSTQSMSPNHPLKRFVTEPILCEDIISYAPKSPSRPVSKAQLVVNANKMGQKMVSELHKREELRLERGPSKRNLHLEKRGSESDILRPVTVQELHKQYHEILNVPRARYDRLSVSGFYYFKICLECLIRRQQ